MERRVFKRKIYDKMLDWKRERNGSTALLLKGARRVGKSTVAKAFAENEYKSYILPQIRNIKNVIGFEAKCQSPVPYSTLISHAFGKKWSIGIQRPLTPSALQGRYVGKMSHKEMFHWAKTSS